MRSNHRHKIRFQYIVYLKFKKWTVKILKNINRKNSAWKQEIIFFPFLRNKSRENWICKNELIFDLRGQTKPNTTEFPFFYCNRWHLRKHQKIKVKNTHKNQFKRRNRIIFSPPDEIIQCSERKMKVVDQKDDKKSPIILR